jgi:dipeptidyl aminopeptidase/acylaminoacyl peptidase
MVIRAVAILTLALLAGVASAQSGPAAAGGLPTVEELTRLPDYADPEISRNGRHLAVLIPVNGRRNLAIIDVAERTRTTLTSHSDFDVIEVEWVGNDRLLYKLGRADSPDGSGEFEGGGLFMISRDGQRQVKLFETVRDARRSNTRVLQRVEFLRTLPGTDEEVMIVGNLRSVDSYDVYRLNILTGQTTLLTPVRPERTHRFVLDRLRVPRIAVSSVKDSTQEIVHFRASETAPWEELLRYDYTRPGIVYPIGFEADNRILRVATNAGRQSMAIHRYDPLARRLLEVIFEHPTLDLGAAANGLTRPAGTVFFDAATDEVTGHTLLGERTSVVWKLAEDRADQRTVDRALPDTYNRLTRLRGDLFLVTARSDRWPTTWHLWDQGKGTVEDILASRPWLLDNKLVQMRPFVLKTRDGLEIPSYYFLPKSHKPGDRLPTVVHVHGGPAVRPDLWGTLSTGIREAQILAARGYAVVLPNFRITPGLGSRVYYAGFGAYGREMLNDHEDAARWAVAQGFADAERICISGASYGGYATLMSLARFPATFKCGVAGLVVSDLPLHLTSPAGDVASNDRGVTFRLALLGLRSVADIPRELSPVNVADRIKQPVMFYAGADDLRTPLEQTTRMVDALTKAGNPPRAVIVKPGEGHGFGRPENVAELYTTMLRFLDEHIGPSRKR